MYTTIFIIFIPVQIDLVKLFHIMNYSIVSH
jgi:hypothetical protein